MAETLLFASFNWRILPVISVIFLPLFAISVARVVTCCCSPDSVRRAASDGLTICWICDASGPICDVVVCTTRPRVEYPFAAASACCACCCRPCMTLFWAAAAGAVAMMFSCCCSTLLTLATLLTMLDCAAPRFFVSMPYRCSSLVVRLTCAARDASVRSARSTCRLTRASSASCFFVTFAAESYACCSCACLARKSSVFCAASTIVAFWRLYSSTRAFSFNSCCPACSSFLYEASS